jgi:hypothetical protein
MRNSLSNNVKFENGGCRDAVDATNNPNKKAEFRQAIPSTRSLCKYHLVLCTLVVPTLIAAQCSDCAQCCRVTDIRVFVGMADAAQSPIAQVGGGRLKWEIRTMVGVE